MQAAIRRLTSLARYGYGLGPYLMLEILMPGGTMLALLLFIYRRRAVIIESLASRTPTLAKRVLEILAGLGWTGPVCLRSAILRSEP